MRSRMMWLMALAILLTASCTKDNTVVVSDATVVDVSDDANVGDLSTDVLSGDTQLPDTTGCELRFRIDNLAIDQAKRTVTITAVAENLTGKPLEITFGDNCPAGSVQFSGAGDGYDYYGTCAAGACSPERPKTHTITIAAGETKTLETVTIALDGDTCNQPIVKGTKLNLSFSLPLVAPQPVVCGPTIVTVGTDF